MWVQLTLLGETMMTRAGDSLPPSIETMDLYVSNFSSLSKLTRNFHYKENKWNFKNLLLSGGWEISQRVEPHKNEDKDVNPQHAC